MVSFSISLLLCGYSLDSYAINSTEKHHPSSHHTPSFDNYGLNNFDLNYSLSSQDNIVDPFIGTAIEINHISYKSFAASEHTYDIDDIPDVGYELQAGVRNYSIGKSLSISVDPRTNKVSSKISMFRSADGKYKMRLKVKPKHIKANFIYRW